MKYPKEFEKYWKRHPLNTSPNADYVKADHYRGWLWGMEFSLKEIKKMKKNCQGIYQHEDIDYLIEDLEEIIKK